MAIKDARRVSSRIMAHGRASSWRVSYSSTLSACELLWCFKNFTPKPISVASRVPSSGCSQVVTPETLYSPSASPTPSKRSAAVVDSRLRSGRWRADGIWSAIFDSDEQRHLQSVAIKMSDDVGSRRDDRAVTLNSCAVPSTSSFAKTCCPALATLHPLS